MWNTSSFWHSSGALPVAPGVAFNLAQPLHPVCPCSLSIQHDDQSKSLGSYDGTLSFILIA